MLTSSDGSRFVLAPWRMRRLLARLREIRGVRRGPGQATPSVLLQDLRRIVRLARPVNRPGPLGTSGRARIYEANTPAGRFRLLTVPGAGHEVLLNVLLPGQGRQEAEVTRGGTISLDWVVDPPRPIAQAIALLPNARSRGVYILYRGASPLYVGMALSQPVATRLREHSALIGRYGNLDGITVSVAYVNGGANSVRHAEHALVRTLLKLGYGVTNIPLRAAFQIGSVPLTIHRLFPPTQSGRLLSRRSGTWSARGGTRRDWEALRLGNRLALPSGESYEFASE